MYFPIHSTDEFLVLQEYQSAFELSTSKHHALLLIGLPAVPIWVNLAQNTVQLLTQMDNAFIPYNPSDIKQQIQQATASNNETDYLNRMSDSLGPLP